MGYAKIFLGLDFLYFIMFIFSNLGGGGKRRRGLVSTVTLGAMHANNRL